MSGLKANTPRLYKIDDFGTKIEFELWVNLPQLIKNIQKLIIIFIMMDSFDGHNSKINHFRLENDILSMYFTPKKSVPLPINVQPYTDRIFSSFHRQIIR